MCTISDCFSANQRGSARLVYSMPGKSGLLCFVVIGRYIDYRVSLRLCLSLCVGSLGMFFLYPRAVLPLISVAPVPTVQASGLRYWRTLITSVYINQYSPVNFAWSIIAFGANMTIISNVGRLPRQLHLRGGGISDGNNFILFRSCGVFLMKNTKSFTGHLAPPPDGVDGAVSHGPPLEFPRRISGLLRRSRPIGRGRGASHCIVYNPRSRNAHTIELLRHIVILCD